MTWLLPPKSALLNKLICRSTFNNVTSTNTYFDLVGELCV